MRLVRNLLLCLLLLAVLAVAGAVIWRKTALEVLGQQTLKLYGFDEAAITVTEVEWGRVALADVAMGPGLPSVEWAEVRFNVRELLHGQVEQVSLRGVRGTIEGTGDTLFNRFARVSGDRAVAPGGEPQGSRQNLAFIPSVILTDGEIDLRDTPIGDGTLRLSGTVAPAETTPIVQLSAALQTSFASATIDMRTENHDDRSTVRLEASGWADFQQLSDIPILRQQAARQAISGQSAFTINGQARLPAQIPQTLDAWLAIPVKAAGSLALSELHTARTPGVFSGRLSWQAQRAGRKVHFSLAEPAYLTLANIPPDKLARTKLKVEPGAPLEVSVETLEVNAEMAEQLSFVHWTGEVSAAAKVGNATGRLTVRANGMPASREIRIATGRLETGPLRFEDGRDWIGFKSAASDFEGLITHSNNLKLGGNFRLESTDIQHSSGAMDRLLLGGSLAASESAAGLTIAAPSVQGTASGLTIPDIADFPGDLRFTGNDIRVEGNKFKGEVSLAEGTARLYARLQDPVPASWEQVTGNAEIEIRGDQQPPIVTGNITVKGGATEIRAAGVSLTGANVSAPLGDGRVTAELVVTDRTAANRFTPVRLRFDGQRTAERVDFNGTASLHRGQAVLPLRVSGNLAAKAVTATLGPGTLAFAPDRLQPGDLSAAGNRIRSVIGTMTVSGLVEIREGQQPDTRGSVSFSDLSAALPGGVVAEGVNGSISLGSLQPLLTAGEQQVTVRRLVAGVPLDDVEARFRIPRSNRGLTIDLSEAGANLAGGRIRVGRAIFRDGSADLRVGISGLSIERLLAEWKVQGLNGTGLISGSLPVSIRPGDVAIGDGQLFSTQPGVIRVDFGSARQTLINAGDQVDLAVRTLENFHYQKLSLGVSKPFDSDLTLAVGMEGKNPDVLDGYPFRFNVNLSGRLEPILEAIQAGERLSTGLLHGSFGR